MPTLQVCNTSEEMKDFAFEYPRSRTSLFYNLKKRANNRQQQSEYVDPLLQEKHVEDYYCSDTEDETITSGSSSVSGSGSSSPTTPTPPSLLIMNQLEDNLSLLTNAMHNHHQKAAARVEPIYLMEESSERDLQWAMDRCYDPLNLVGEEEQEDQGFTAAGATVTTVNKKSETENAAATHRPLHHHPSHHRFDPIQNMESQLKNLKKGVQGVAHLFLYDGVQAPLSSKNKKENQQETRTPPKNGMSSKEPWPCGDAYLSNPSVQAQILQDIQLANQQKQHDRSSSNNKSFSILVATTTIEDDDFELDVDQDGNVSVWC